MFARTYLRADSYLCAGQAFNASSQSLTRLSSAGQQRNALPLALPRPGRADLDSRQSAGPESRAFTSGNTGPEPSTASGNSAEKPRAEDGEEGEHGAGGGHVAAVTWGIFDNMEVRGRPITALR